MPKIIPMTIEVALVIPTISREMKGVKGVKMDMRKARA